MGAALPCLDAAHACLGAEHACLRAALPCLDAAHACLGAALPCLRAALPCLDAAHACLGAAKCAAHSCGDRYTTDLHHSVRLRTADCGLRTADCGLRTADCGLRAAGCGLRTAITRRRRWAVVGTCGATITRLPTTRPHIYRTGMWHRATERTAVPTTIFCVCAGALLFPVVTDSRSKVHTPPVGRGVARRGEGRRGQSCKAAGWRATASAWAALHDVARRRRFFYTPHGHATFLQLNAPITVYLSHRISLGITVNSIPHKCDGRCTAQTAKWSGLLLHCRM